MVSAITEILEVGAYRSWKIVNEKPVCCYYWVGFEADVALADYTFLLLQRGIQSGIRARRKEFRSMGCLMPGNFNNSYAMGFIISVEEKLRVLARQSQQDEIPAPAGSANLPVLKHNAIDRYMEGLGLEESREKHSPLDRSSFQLGSMDGQDFRVYRPVEGACGIVRALA